MKQKYLANGKILVEFKYKDVEYKKEFFYLFYPSFSTLPPF